MHGKPRLARVQRVQHRLWLAIFDLLVQYFNNLAMSMVVINVQHSSLKRYESLEVTMLRKINNLLFYTAILEKVRSALL